MSKESIPSFEHMPPREVNLENGLQFRAFQEEDAVELLELVNDPAVRRFVPWAKFIKDRDTAHRAIDGFTESFEKGNLVRYKVNRGGSFIGYTGIWRDQHPDYYEFGFAILPEMRGRGLGKEIAEGILKIARDELKARGMVAYVHDDNLPSSGVIKSLGFIPTEQFDDGDRRYVLDFEKSI